MSPEPLLLPTLAAPPPPARRRRVAALDAFRGFNVMLMIFVDNVGAAFPTIDHSPWDGVALADLVMPWFDFMVGVSLALSLKKFVSSGDSTNGGVMVGDNGVRQPLTRSAGCRKVSWRFFKIFLLGVFTQGCKDPFVCDLAHIRIMGILQRVALCFLVGAAVELATGTRTERAEMHCAVFFRARWHWIAAVVLCGIWTAIMYGVDVAPAFGARCGRGVFTPACNAQRVVDQAVFGVDHMYFPTNGGDTEGRDITFERLPECSSCSPGKCVPPPNSTVEHPWCTEAPFDPEGLVSSLTASADTLFGAHAGFVLLVLVGHRARLVHWTVLGLAMMLLVALPLHFSGSQRMNTDLYTIAFLFFTSGAGMLVLALFYYMTEIVGGAARTAVQPAVWVGRNAITMYICAESGFVQWAFGIFYVGGDPDNSLAGLLWPGTLWANDGDDTHRPSKASHNPAVMVWTLCYIGLWTVVAWWMDQRKIYIKL